MATDTIIQRSAPEFEAYILGLMERAKGLSEQEKELPGFEVAGMTDLQLAALNRAGTGIGAYQDYLDRADAAITGAGRKLTQDEISEYMNPFQDAIQKEIMRAYDERQAQQGLANVLQGGGAAAFGDRGQLLRGKVEQGRADALVRAAAENFTNAAGMAERQLGREAAMGQGIASLGAMDQRLGQDQTRFMFDLGELERMYNQAGLDATRQTQLAQLYEPEQRISYLSDIFRGVPSGSQTVSTSADPSVSPFQQYAGLGIAGLSAAAGAQKAGLFG